MHGAWHGPWCWERLTGPLRNRGHDVVVPDLPSEDTEAGLNEYADEIDRALGDAGDVVLVPHSLGGLVGPVVAARRPLKALVYLCALLPEAGLSFNEQLAAAKEPVLNLAGGRQVDDQGRSHWPDPETTVRIMYGELSPEDARWAAGQLKPQAQKSQGERSPAPPAELRVESVIGANDRLLSPDWSRHAARTRLGVEAIEIPAGHFPMITHPELVADALAQLDAE
ncbi:MAG TPA: alpha/beta hydrolase [Thermoleophilaceae bacterium]|nr:alpha/beta hydrolase [Thermoleophilaceae bacterium]